MRELDLLQEYLRKQIAERQGAALKRLREEDMALAAVDAKIADVLQQVSEDIKVLQSDANEFINQFLAT